jgi:hypothetical protein
MRHTIRTLDELAEPNRQRAKVRYRFGPQMPWQFAMLAGNEPHQFTGFNGGFGYTAHKEVSRGVHADTLFTDRGFANGLEVQLATDEEAQGKEWSYGYR